MVSKIRYINFTERDSLIDPGHRQFLVIQGEAETSRKQALRLLVGLDCVWISTWQPGQAKRKSSAQVNDLLGQEVGCLVFDSHCGFNPDAFAAACGLVVGGGLFILLVPPLDEWAGRTDPELERLAVHGYDLNRQPSLFIRRLVALIRSTPALLDPPNPKEIKLRLRATTGGGTAEQDKAVAAVVRVATGHRRRPLVLTADRGRGKSAALGMAAAELLRQGRKTILVTAPRLDATHSLFRHASSMLPLATSSRGHISLEDRQIRFIAPDVLIREQPAADLVLVDEAAAIPLPLLQALIKQYSRIAFATTVHGYEGSGRGFSIRFAKTLDTIAPQWKEQYLRQPIRWAAGDPLEAFCFKAMLLNAEAADVGRFHGHGVDNLEFKLLDRKQLLEDNALLEQLFGLLVTAHYRTTPFDLRHLLDGPNVSVWVAGAEGQVLAAALTAQEGNFDKAISREIWYGRRRPRGHLLPESLAVHVGLADAPELNYMRVIRLAVHPDLQGRGIGSKLLWQLARGAEQQGMDLVGASFGVTVPLLRFWRLAGFTPVRLGFRREASSGTHSAILIRGLTDTGRRLVACARAHFVNQLPSLLAEPLRTLEPGIAVGALSVAGRAVTLSSETRAELGVFAAGGREYEDALYALRKMVLCLAEESFSALSEGDAELLICKILQGQEWQACCSLFDCNGRKQLVSRLRMIVNNVLER